ncbi:MAG: DNA methyltransferase [Gemmatimonadota bacterium]
MRLSWNEIRAHAAAFAQEWAGEGYEKGQTQLFYRDLFEVFGMPIRRVASFEEPVRRLGEKRGYIDLFWRGVLLVEQKSAGRDLKTAKVQALDYFPGLKDADLPRYLLLSDFQSFELYDLEEDESATFLLADLPAHVEKFGFILGVQKRTFRDQDPVNIAASESVGRLHDALEEVGYAGHDLERFLVRIVFCLFADDTGIFEPRGAFHDLIETRTAEDGSDLGLWLSQLFQILDTPPEARSKILDEELARFPYVNGELFAGPLRIPSFNAEMRGILLDAGAFDWSKISPAIFGSLFQSVMEPRERRAQGAHYTTEKNILKVIEPLFLDDLRAEFARLKGRRDTGRRMALKAFHARLADLTFFDPACGCGNFLIIAYRELRALEIELLRELQAYEGEAQMDLHASDLSLLDVDQFYGIEIGEFPARIAETALWMMDHIMNNRLSLEFGQTYARIPLRSAPHIRHADALEVEWEAVLPAAECDYLLGNPPFVGAKFQSPAQRAQVRRIAGLGGTGGTLDYVAAWYIRGGAYARKGGARIGFVSTNSLTQGEQVAQLWPILFERFELEITFAHRTFAWGSDARGRAHVHVVILGLGRAEDAPVQRRLFSYDDVNGDPHESVHAGLTAYLTDTAGLRNPHLVVREESRPINGMPRLLTGTQPIDEGQYIFTDEEREAFLEVEPEATPWLRPFLGAKELLHGERRWIVHPDSIPREVLRTLPRVRERMARVREYRRRSRRSSTLGLADSPGSFQVTVIPKGPFMVIPEVSSERREYAPIGWLEPPTIPSNLLRVLIDARLWHFGLLTSRMHMAWLRMVTGRMKSDYRYSVGVVYNTFPLPPGGGAALEGIEPLAQEVLDARLAHPGATLADLYDPDTMPANLRKAHRVLDRAEDRLYRKKAFDSDRERVEHLFALYEAMTNPLQTMKPANQPRARSRRG